MSPVCYSVSEIGQTLNFAASWMQWLRHTRFEPPTLQEQRQELMRQERIRLLAAQADARWAEKPSALDAPDKQQPAQMLQSRDPDSGVVQPNIEEDIRQRASENVTTEEQERKPLTTEDAQAMPQDASEAAAVDDAPTLTTRKRMKKEPKDSPWKKAAQGNPGQDWQPTGWSPGPAKKRS